jgi:hypothetical protein
LTRKYIKLAITYTPYGKKNQTIKEKKHYHKKRVRTIWLMSTSIHSKQLLFLGKGGIPI